MTSSASGATGIASPSVTGTGVSTRSPPVSTCAPPVSTRAPPSAGLFETQPALLAPRRTNYMGIQLELPPGCQPQALGSRPQAQGSQVRRLLGKNLQRGTRVVRPERPQLLPYVLAVVVPRRTRYLLGPAELHKVHRDPACLAQEHRRAGRKDSRRGSCRPGSRRDAVQRLGAGSRIRLGSHKRRRGAGSLDMPHKVRPRGPVVAASRAGPLQVDHRQLRRPCPAVGRFRPQPQPAPGSREVAPGIRRALSGGSHLGVGSRRLQADIRQLVRAAGSQAHMGSLAAPVALQGLPEVAFLVDRRLAAGIRPDAVLPEGSLHRKAPDADSCQPAGDIRAFPGARPASQVESLGRLAAGNRLAAGIRMARLEAFQVASRMGLDRPLAVGSSHTLVAESLLAPLAEGRPRAGRRSGLHVMVTSSAVATVSVPGDRHRCHVPKESG